MVKRAVEMEGTVTGEHGVGLIKRDYLPHELDEETVDAMRKVCPHDPLTVMRINDELILLTSSSKLSTRSVYSIAIRSFGLRSLKKAKYSRGEQVDSSKDFSIVIIPKAAPHRPILSRSNPFEDGRARRFSLPLII